MIEYDPQTRKVTINGPLTQEEIGLIFGFSRQRAVELEERAMKKIRRVAEVLLQTEKTEIE